VLQPTREGTQKQAPQHNAGPAQRCKPQSTERACSPRPPCLRFSTQAKSGPGAAPPWEHHRTCCGWSPLQRFVPTRNKVPHCFYVGAHNVHVAGYDLRRGAHGYECKHLQLEQAVSHVQCVSTQLSARGTVVGCSARSHLCVSIGCATSCKQVN